MADAMANPQSSAARKSSLVLDPDGAPTRRASLLGCWLVALLSVSACGDSGAAIGGQSSAGGSGAGGSPSKAGGGGGGPTDEGGGGADPVGAGGAGGAGECLAATNPCEDTEECCAGLSCGTTTLGQVCCGEEAAPCGTPNGEDCCGDLLCVAGTCLSPGAMPNFQAPFPCDESWTYSHHSQEVRRALDFIDNAGNTNGAPALAAASGTATQHYEAGGAGNYIVIDHGGGWKTYYFHLQAFSVDDGEAVEQGQEVGLVGSTGASSGPHLHFEELLNGEGQDIWINGQPLAPYPGSYYQESIVSENCPDD